MLRDESIPVSDGAPRVPRRARGASDEVPDGTPALALVLDTSPHDTHGMPVARPRSGSRAPRKRSRELSSARVKSASLVPAEMMAKRYAAEEGYRASPSVRDSDKPASEVDQKSVGAMGPPPRPVVVYPFPSSDDKDGHIVYSVGDGLGPCTEYPQGRYRILGLLGEGTFGKVLKCWGFAEQGTVAVKVVRAIPKYREAARVEVEVLTHLDRNDPEDWYNCVKLLSWFEYRGHACMVFEKLGPSLYDVLRRRQFRPFSIEQVREYAWQLLESVQFLHSLSLIHTDLKPENILHDEMRTMWRTGNAIKLIDFGSATFNSWKHNEVISTRHYRAPEVILGNGWTFPCDLWSVGCILAELYTGEVLFQTHHDLEHLALMNAVLGAVPQSVAGRVTGSAKKYFRPDSCGGMALNWPEGATSRASVRTVRKTRSLSQLVPVGTELSVAFLDLLTKLLAFEPSARCSASEALRHHFFRGNQESEMPTLSSGSSACGAESISWLSGAYFQRRAQAEPAPNDPRIHCRDEDASTVDSGEEAVP